MKGFFIQTCLLLIAFAMQALAQSVNTVHQVKPSQQYQRFTEGITVFPVCTGKAPAINEVSQPAFQANFRSDSVFQQGCKHWMRVQLYSDSKKPLQYLLRNNNRFGTSHYYILQKDSTFDHLKSGVTVPPEERAYPYPGYNAIPIICVPQDTLTVFIFQDFTTSDPDRKVQLSYMNWGTAEIKQKAEEHNTLLTTFAAFALLIIYNLAIYIFVKDSAYLFYSLTFIFLLPYLLVIHYTEWQWIYHTENTEWLPRLLISSGMLAGLFYNLFSLKYLKGKEERFRGEITLRKTIYGLSFFMQFSIPLVLIVGYGNNSTVFHLMADILLFGTVMLIFLYSVVLSFKGSISARYYATASISFLPFLAIFYLQGPSFGHYGYLNLIEGSAFTRASLKIGMVVQALMFALALAARINILRKELLAQELKVERVEREKLQTVNQLIERQNSELEAKVRQRTLSLQEANEELRISEENLDRLNQAKDRLFAVVAHDLREPIISFQMISKVLTFQMKKNRPEKVEELITQIDGSANQLNAMLDNLLKWAQTQMDGIQQQPQQTLLMPIAENIAEIYQSTALGKNVTSHLEVKPENLAAWVDPNFATTIIRNLWSNAIKFTQSGEVTLKAYAVDEKVWVEITDTGVGISPEKLATIFEINSAKSTKGTLGEKGNGLGLNLCKTFVEKSGGEITVRSEEGKGTTIRFWLPAFQLKMDS